MEINVKNAPLRYLYLTHDEMIAAYPNCYKKRKKILLPSKLLTPVYEAHNDEFDLILFFNMGIPANTYAAFKLKDSPEYELKLVSNTPERIDVCCDLGFMSVAIIGRIDEKHVPSSKIRVFALNQCRCK